MIPAESQGAQTLVEPCPGISNPSVAGSNHAGGTYLRHCRVTVSITFPRREMRHLKRILTYRLLESLICRAFPEG